MGKYYEDEIPVSFSDKQGRTIAFYKNAGVLAMTGRSWFSPEGEEKHGRTVSFRCCFSRGDEQLIAVLNEVLEYLKS